MLLDRGRSVLFIVDMQARLAPAMARAEAILARTRILHFYGRLKPWDDHEPRRRVDACYLRYAPAPRQASAGST